MNFTKNGEKLVIASALRTPIGQAAKSLSQFESYDLGYMVIEELLTRHPFLKNKIDLLVAGEISQSSRAPNVARVLSVKSGLPLSAVAVTVANNCVSGFEAIIEAARRVLLGESSVALAVGLESMSNMPLYLCNAQKNAKTANLDKINKNWAEIPTLDDVKIVNSVDEGLVDPVRGANMAETAEVVSQSLGLSKKNLDQYAWGSFSKSLKAIETGKYKPYIVPVKHNDGILENDEYIMSKTGFVEKPERFEKATGIFNMPPHTSLKSFYEKYEKWIGKSFTENAEATVSLFNACPRSDGAGALIVTTESKARELGLPVQAIISGWGNYGVDPIFMGLGIAYAMNQALVNTNKKWEDIDGFEIHEAFAATALGSIVKVKQEWKFDLEKKLSENKINPNGGTLALGHPLGATGIRIAINQIMQLEQTDAKQVMGAICAGGGVGGALILEKP